MVRFLIHVLLRCVEEGRLNALGGIRSSQVTLLNEKYAFADLRNVGHKTSRDLIYNVVPIGIE
jgi:hypothetical protein